MPFFVQGGEAAQHLTDHRQRGFGPNAAVEIGSLVQRAAQVFGDQEHQAIGGAIDIDDGGDVRIAHRR